MTKREEDLALRAVGLAVLQERVHCIYDVCVHCKAGDKVEDSCGIAKHRIDGHLRQCRAANIHARMQR